MSLGWADENETIQVIVNSQSELTELNQKQVMSIFLGRARFFPNGLHAKPLDNEMGSKIRSEFFEQLTGKSISDIDAYWARLSYSGRATPPKALDDSEKIIEAVSRSQNAISYIEEQSIEDLTQKGIVVVHVLPGN